MFSTILIPVDLAHTEKLSKAIDAAISLAQSHDASLVYCGVTANTPGSVAHNPTEFKQKLDAYVAEQNNKTGIDGKAIALTSHDPSRELDQILLKAIKDSDADLVVMASHVPGIAEHIFASNAGWLAAHAPVSVMVIR